MVNLRVLELKQLLFYAVLTFFSTKLITFLYIYIHNSIESNQWGYSLLFRNQNIEKTLGNLLSPLVLAPVFETLVFCVLISFLCKKIKITGKYFIFISAILFGVYHLLQVGSGWYRFSFTFFAGIIFAYCYYKQEKKYGENIAFIFTLCVHSFSNALSAFI
jgi:membrane protease YdiL (CAAX protease family)